MVLEHYYKEHLSSPQARRFAQTLDRLARDGPLESYPLGRADDPEHALEDALAAVQAVRCDDPRIFWLGCPWHAESTRLLTGWRVELKASCPYPPERCPELLTSALASADRLTEEIRAKAPTLAVAERFLFDAIYRIPYVNDGAPNRHNLLGPFLDHACVCEGKALAFSYIANRLGIPCMVVYGKGRGEDHAWNIIQLNGQFLFLDCTWGWKYFNRPLHEMAATHTPDPLFPLRFTSLVPLPRIRLPHYT